MHLIAEGGAQVVVRDFEVVREIRVGGVVAQGGLQPLSRRASFRREATHGNAVASDHDGLSMLDRVEDVGEVPCRLRGGYCNH